MQVGWLPQGLRFMDYYMNFTFGVVEATNDRELTVSLIPGDFPPAKARSLSARRALIGMS